VRDRPNIASLERRLPVQQRRHILTLLDDGGKFLPRVPLPGASWTRTPVRQGPRHRVRATLHRPGPRGYTATVAHILGYGVEPTIG
jgi:hypothetical protein